MTNAQELVEDLKQLESLAKEYETHSTNSKKYFKAFKDKLTYIVEIVNAFPKSLTRDRKLILQELTPLVALVDGSDIPLNKIRNAKQFASGIALL